MLNQICTVILNGMKDDIKVCSIVVRSQVGNWRKSRKGLACSPWNTSFSAQSENKLTFTIFRIHWSQNFLIQDSHRWMIHHTNIVVIRMVNITLCDAQMLYIFNYFEPILANNQVFYYNNNNILYSCICTVRTTWVLYFWKKTIWWVENGNIRL